MGTILKIEINELEAFFGGGQFSKDPEPKPEHPHKSGGNSNRKAPAAREYLGIQTSGSAPGSTPEIRFSAGSRSFLALFHFLGKKNC
ncbi:hypothetical protein VN97_g6905 [Penicillium thymicola]|uniref:Uncharacterized protein n=1 Tax=Penicillium thymicola TaxID=293382 RepID=A0AAI9X771_PENTH|nr:hypothetical protein VN97_g6905 [Penicillium thymicola]